MKYTPLFSCLLLLIPLLNAQTPENLNLGTTGNYAPSVYAKDASIAYGLHPRIIDELLVVFQKNEEELIDAEQKVEELLNKYNTLSQEEKVDKELSPYALKELEITYDSDLTNIMQWAVYTHGDKSPAVFALGNVEIWYGLSQDAFKSLYEIFLEKQGELLLKDGRLAEFEAQIDEHIKKYNELRAELNLREDEMAKEAQLLLDKGRLKEAIEVLKNRYAFKEAKLKREQLETAEAAFDYAQSLELGLEYLKSKEIFQRAIQLNPENTDYLYQFAMLETQIGNLQEAVNLFEKVINTDSTKHGTIIQERISESYNQLGIIYQILGQYRKAVQCLDLSIKISSKIFGVSHSKISTYFNNLGVIYKESGDYKTAKALFTHSLNTDIELFGSIHPRIAIALNNLANTYLATRDYDTALELSNQALIIKLQLYNKTHPNLITTYNNLGQAFRGKMELDLGRIFFNKALEINLNVFGDNHPNVADSYINIAGIYRAEGKPEIAIELLKKALQISLHHFGEIHPVFVIIYDNMSVYYEDLKEIEMTIQLLGQSLNMNQQIFGYDSPHVANSYFNLGFIYQKYEEPETAVGYYEKALTIYLKNASTYQLEIQALKKHIEECKNE